MNFTQGINNRKYEHRFDWDQARSLRAAGMSYDSIARRLRVSPNAVARVCDPERYHDMKVAVRNWQRAGRCIDCGALGRTRYIRKYSNGRCKSCATKASATSVREHELQCHRCQLWKPDDSFQSCRTRQARRGRHQYCRQCNTEVKREWRERHPDRYQASLKRDQEKRRARKLEKTQVS